MSILKPKTEKEIESGFKKLDLKEGIIYTLNYINNINEKVIVSFSYPQFFNEYYFLVSIEFLLVKPSKFDSEGDRFKNTERLFLKNFILKCFYKYIKLKYDEKTIYTFYGLNYKDLKIIVDYFKKEINKKIQKN